MKPVSRMWFYGEKKDPYTNLMYNVERNFDLHWYTDSRSSVLYSSSPTHDEDPDQVIFEEVHWVHYPPTPPLLSVVSLTKTVRSSDRVENSQASSSFKCRWSL